jgi:SpoVK/Ycf46/Vps4 family AAA+-type ATPase
VSPALATGNPVELLMNDKLKRLPSETILCMMNVHMFMDRTPGGLAGPLIQAIWNVRDYFKKLRSTLVLLWPGFQLPIELQHDVIILDEPLPDNDERQVIIKRTLGDNGMKTNKTLLATLSDATSGLSPFAIQNIIGMSVVKGKNGKGKVDQTQVWERTVHKIESTAGLTIHRGGPTFADIGGNENIKSFFRRLIASGLKPSLILFFDEIEKSLMAAGTDTTGVTSDQHKVLLTEIQNNGWGCMLFHGFPGTGKSLLAKALGNECGVYTVEADLGGMKDIWVGSSEARFRNFIKVIKARGQNKVFIVATCNDIHLLSAPLLRRLALYGIWWSDFPNAEERKPIWDIKLKEYKLTHQPIPNDEGWSGAEIDNCCLKAKNLGISLMETQRYMTIVSHSMGDQVEKMRRAASGKYVSTQHAGVYTYNGDSIQDKIKAALKGGK